MTSYQGSRFCVGHYVSLNSKFLIPLVNSQRISLFPVIFIRSTKTLGLLTLLEMIADPPASEMAILGSVPSIGAFCLIISPGSLFHNNHRELLETLSAWPPKGATCARSTEDQATPLGKATDPALGLSSTEVMAVGWPPAGTRAAHSPVHSFAHQRARQRQGLFVEGRHLGCSHPTVSGAVSGGSSFACLLDPACKT